MPTGQQEQPKQPKQQIVLTAQQLASFDQIIADRQQGVKIFGKIKVNTEKIVEVIVLTAQAVVAVTQLLGKKANLTNESILKSSITDLVNETAVEDLMEIRKNVITKG